MTMRNFLFYSTQKRLNFKKKSNSSQVAINITKLRRRQVFQFMNARFVRERRYEFLVFFRKLFPNVKHINQISRIILILFPFISSKSNLFLTSYLYRCLSNVKSKSNVTILSPLFIPNFSLFVSKPNHPVSNSDILSKLGLFYPALFNRYRNLTRTLDLTKTLVVLKLLSHSLLSLTSSLSYLSRMQAPRWLYYWINFTSLYGTFYEIPQFQLYTRSAANRKKSFKHLINFRFRGSKLALTLTDEKTHSTHFFLAPGLLLKYFGRRKSLKKTKTMKFLVIRFLRKILLILKLSNIVIHFKGIPVLLDLLLQMLYQPIAHPLKDPFRGFEINESTKQRYSLKVSELVFTSPKPFGYLKPRKRGRIKRKIRRRVMRSTFVIDEM